MEESQQITSQEAGENAENLGLVPAVPELMGVRGFQHSTAEMQVVQAALPRMGHVPFTTTRCRATG